MFSVCVLQQLGKKARDFSHEGCCARAARCGWPGTHVYTPRPGLMHNHSYLTAVQALTELHADAERRRRARAPESCRRRRRKRESLKHAHKSLSSAQRCSREDGQGGGNERNREADARCWIVTAPTSLMLATSAAATSFLLAIAVSYVNQASLKTFSCLENPVVRPHRQQVRGSGSLPSLSYINRGDGRARPTTGSFTREPATDNLPQCGPRFFYGAESGRVCESIVG